jgi:hypothetical protein
MKKILLSVCALMVAVATFAQQARMAEMPKEVAAKYVANTEPLVVPSVQNSAPASIWEDDCSDANTWIFTNTSTLNIDWAVEMDPNTIPVSVLSPMASATAANGYMFISSDANNTGDNDGTPIVAEFTNATPVDLSAYLNVRLSFSHNFRWWNDTRGVRVSGDNGATWTEFEITNQTAYSTPDQNSDNPHISEYNISTIAGGQSQVLVQFYYNDNDIWAWYWAVDDVVISEIPDNEITMQDEVSGGWWVAYQIAGGLGQDYTFNPLSQVAANPYSFESVIVNNGTATQNVTMHVEVTEDASSSVVFTGSSSTIALDVSEQDTFATTTTFAPTVGGLYTTDMWGIGDSANTDTTNLMSIVTDYVYGKDYNSLTGTWQFARTTGGLEVGADYDIYAAANLYSVDTYIADYSVVGTPVYAVLYEIDADPNVDPIWLAQTDDYVLTASDIDNWISIPFLSAQPLVAGTTFSISIGGYSSPTDTAGVGVSGTGTASSDRLLDKDDIYGNGANSWYSISDIPMLRMNFNPASVNAVSAVEKSNINVYPNPSNGIFTMDVDVIDYAVSVTNVLGQTVYSVTVSELSTIIDLSSFNKGIYTIKLTNTDNTISKKVIVE